MPGKAAEEFVEELAGQDEKAGEAALRNMCRGNESLWVDGIRAQRVLSSPPSIWSAAFKTQAGPGAPRRVFERFFEKVGAGFQVVGPFGTAKKAVCREQKAFSYNPRNDPSTPTQP